MSLLDIFTFRRKKMPESVKNGLQLDKEAGGKVKRFKNKYSSNAHESIKNGFEYDGTFSGKLFNNKNSKEDLTH